MSMRDEYWIPLSAALAKIEALDPEWDAKSMIKNGLCSGLLRSRSAGGSARNVLSRAEALGVNGDIPAAVWKSFFDDSHQPWRKNDINWQAGSCKLYCAYEGQLSFIRLHISDMEQMVGHAVMMNVERYFGHIKSSRNIERSLEAMTRQADQLSDLSSVPPSSLQPEPPLKVKGRPRGSGGWRKSDAIIVEKMRKMIEESPDTSVFGAAIHFASEASGNGEPESKQRRLAERYKSTYPD